MSIIQHKSQILFATLVLLVIAAVACSSEPESDPTPTPTLDTSPVVGNYETCKGFMSVASIAESTGVVGLIERVSVTDVASFPDLAESGATDSCLIEIFRSVDGSENPVPGESVTLSLVRFESSEIAGQQYDSALASAIISTERLGDVAVVQQGVVGSDSYLMEITALGIGAIVIFVFDSTFVSMSSTPDAANNALFDGQNLVIAAQSVQSRLP